MAEKIVIGFDPSNPLFVFENPTIQSCSCVLNSSLSGEELAIDQFMPVVYSASYIRVSFVPVDSTGLLTVDGEKFMAYPNAGFLDKLPYSTPIWYYSNDVLIGKFYSNRIVRSGKSMFDVLAVSAIGVLDGQQHYGGIYDGQSFEEVAGEIINEQFEFTCADDVKNIKVYGWLPIGTRRDNLHQLLFAYGAALYKDGNGNIVFRFPDTETVKNIPDNRVFYGGQVDYQTPATKAEVTEHTFVKSPADEIVTLYDNTDGEVADVVFVSFSDAPIYDLQTTDLLTIEEFGVNYAIVSGTGVLTGKKYSHTTHVLSAEVKKSKTDKTKEKTVSVTDATLVNVANSENVLKRTLSYYSAARIIRSDIVLENEMAGDQVAFNNPYGEVEQAFISSMDINATSFLRASCEMIAGYYPSGGGNNYTNSEVLTGSGVWESPVSGKIRVAIIGGGSGGSGGYCGESGDGYRTYCENSGREGFSVYYVAKNGGESFVGKTPRGEHPNTIYHSGGQSAGVGGNPGVAGVGGKVLIVSLDVAKGQRFNFNCGVGGIGGVGQKYTDGLLYNVKPHSFSDPTNGTAGTDSVFGAWSSADGFAQDAGFVNVITNEVYAQMGKAGTTGGTGFLGAAEVTHEGGGVGGLPGTGVDANAHYYDTDANFKDLDALYSCGGGGDGGAAFGVSAPRGKNGTDYFVVNLGSTVGTTMLHGMGAKGATPIKPEKPVFPGQGGAAGHGGGGGGTAGRFSRELRSRYAAVLNSMAGGLGGDGGDGGDGADGGIVIYY